MRDTVTNKDMLWAVLSQCWNNIEHANDAKKSESYLKSQGTIDIIDPTSVYPI